MVKTLRKGFLAVVLAVVALFTLASCVIGGNQQPTEDPTNKAQAALNEFTANVTFGNTDAYTIYTVTPDGVRVNIRIDADVAIKVNSIMKNKTWETFKDCTFLNVVGIVQPYYENYQLMVMNLTDLGYQN
jgi:hypothetical protein